MLGWAKHLRSSKHLPWQNGFSSRLFIVILGGFLASYQHGPLTTPQFVMTWGACRAPDDVITEAECVDPGFGVTLIARGACKLAQPMLRTSGDPVKVEDRTKHHERSTRNGLPSLRSSGGR